MIPQLQRVAYRHFVMLAMIACAACRRGKQPSPQPPELAAMATDHLGARSGSAAASSSGRAGLLSPARAELHEMGGTDPTGRRRIAGGSVEPRLRGDAAAGVQLRLGKRVELGGGHPLAATTRGIVLRAGRDIVRGWEFPGGSATGGVLPVEPSGKPSSFWGPPPAVTEDSFAYFVAQGRVVRERIRGERPRPSPTPGGPRRAHCPRHRQFRRAPRCRATP